MSFIIYFLLSFKKFKSIFKSLSINNTKISQQIKEPGTEIMIVIDNSASMSQESSDGNIRKTLLLDSVNTLIDKIYENSKDTKVGIVRFAGIWNEDDYDCDDTDYDNSSSSGFGGSSSSDGGSYGGGGTSTGRF